MQTVTDKTTVIPGDFNISFPVVDTTRRKKINSDTEDATTPEQPDTTDSYRTLRPITEEHTQAIQQD